MRSKYRPNATFKMYFYSWIMIDTRNKQTCDSCSPNPCLNGGKQFAKLILHYSLELIKIHCYIFKVNAKQWVRVTFLLVLVRRDFQVVFTENFWKDNRHDNLSRCYFKDAYAKIVIRVSTMECVAIMDVASQTLTEAPDASAIMATVVRLVRRVRIETRKEIMFYLRIGML